MHSVGIVDYVDVRVIRVIAHVRVTPTLWRWSKSQVGKQLLRVFFSHPLEVLLLFRVAAELRVLKQVLKVDL
jgi:hypothetical protein